MEDNLTFLSTKMAIREHHPFLGFFEVRGRLNPPVAQTIDEIKEFYKNSEYLPFFLEERGEHIIRLTPAIKIKDRPNYWLNILLFLGTILTTLLAGSMNSGGDPFRNFSDILKGIPFSFSLMAILTCHELGHYFVSKRLGMVTSLPYFIPVPFHFLGTFGAIIKMKSFVPSRRALLMVGMSGPICGFLVALIISILGMMLSEAKIAPPDGSYLKLGDSLLFYLLGKIIHPNIPEGADIFLHPTAFAGWIGFLVTSMNLIPIGQLDGGHIAYSILVKNMRYLYLPLIVILVGFGILWPGWIIWGLIAFLLTRKQPVLQDTITPLSKREKSLALLPLFVLILTFIPQPFKIIS